MHYPIARIGWLCLLLLLMSGAAVAKNHNITVGGSTPGGGYYGGDDPVLMFSPSALTIDAGDTVTFNNAGGSHNVVADNGAFRCANGCDGDGAGGNGAPSGNDWSTAVTFPTAGTFGVHCEVHGAMYGMRATITVNAVTPPAGTPIGGATSGAWYNPQQSGHGFIIQIYDTNNTFLAVWFVYTPDGTQQAWVWAQGTYDPTSNSITIPNAFYTKGARFPPNFVPGSATHVPWGSITFTFDSCNSGTATWSSSIPEFGSGSMPLTRLAGIKGLSCP